MNLQVEQTARRSMRVTAKHVEQYAQLTGDRNPQHFDEAFAAGPQFGRLVAQGGITTGLLHALVAMDMPGPGTVFLNQTWQFTAPVYIGDTNHISHRLVRRGLSKPAAVAALWLVAAAAAALSFLL